MTAPLTIHETTPGHMSLNAVIVVGPTGVGKSHWALEYARQHQGTIINADSQQCYQACPILTARPSAEEQSNCPHLGYGILASDKQTTVGWWLETAREYICQTKHPVIVGGTGMYIDALLNGLSDIPHVQPEILAQVDAFAQKPGWTDHVKSLDPTLPETMVDPQRLKRALGVLWQTGRSITTFWQERRYAVPQLRAHVVVLDMPMSLLAPRLEERFINMLTKGAIEEVRSFLDQPEPSYKGISCALGFRNIMEFLKGRTTLEEAVHQTHKDTRLYAKRQRTWFRNRIATGPLVEKVTIVG